VIIYTDILFCTNFFMDYLIITVCSAIVPGETKHIRKMLASLLGGIYGVCMFIPDFEFICSIFAVFLFSAAISAVVICPCRIKDFFRYLIVYYITSFLLAGSIYMILPFIGGGVVRNNVIYYDGVGILAVAAGTAFFVVKCVKYLKTHRGKEEYNVKIKYKDKVVKTNGILDTGNLLKDPKSGKTVVVGDEELLKKLFSKECNIFNISEWVESTDIRLVPYKTLAGEGVMTGFMADEIHIDKEIIKDIIVAVSPHRLENGVLLNIAKL